MNPTDFNDEMVELGIGADGPSKFALAVQCNYERNYALIEVSGHCYGIRYSRIHIFFIFSKTFVVAFLAADKNSPVPQHSLTNTNDLAARICILLS